MEGWLDGWMDGEMERWADGWMGDGGMAGWVDGEMDRWVDDKRLKSKPEGGQVSRREKGPHCFIYRDPPKPCPLQITEEPQYSFVGPGRVPR